MTRTPLTHGARGERCGEPTVRLGPSAHHRLRHHCLCRNERGARASLLRGQRQSSASCRGEVACLPHAPHGTSLCTLSQRSWPPLARLADRHADPYQIPIPNLAGESGPPAPVQDPGPSSPVTPLPPWVGVSTISGQFSPAGVYDLPAVTPYGVWNYYDTRGRRHGSPQV